MIYKRLNQVAIDFIVHTQVRSKDKERSARNIIEMLSRISDVEISQQQLIEKLKTSSSEDVRQYLYECTSK